MKRIFKMALALILGAGILTGCSSNGNPSQATPTPEEGCKIRVGLVTDTGGVDDKSFNQSTWEGVTRFAADNGISDECISYLQSTGDSDYIPNLSQFADEEYDLIIATGYLFAQAIDSVSANYADRNFLFIDEVSENANVASATFAAEQGSFLVGVAAATVAIEEGSNTVGFIGGMEGPLIGAFQAGFEQGVLAVNPDIKILVDYCASFEDASIGQSLAVKQYNAGATVIYQAAGAAGNGVIKEAKERGDVWAIGVDKDQYEEGMKEDGTSVILTSMIKRVDQASNMTAQAVLDNQFQGGIVHFDLTNDGVGAELTAGRNLTDEWIAIINDYATKIKAGEITVSPDAVIPNGSSNK